MVELPLRNVNSTPQQQIRVWQKKNMSNLTPAMSEAPVVVVVVVVLERAVTRPSFRSAERGLVRRPLKPALFVKKAEHSPRHQ